MFPVDKLILKPLSDRINDIDMNIISDLNDVEIANKKIIDASKKIINARKNKASVILMMGAHVIRSGVQKYIIDLMEKGYISLLSFNGACVIHDFEYALIGATTESVAKYIQNGQFGLWKETSKINDIINKAYSENKISGYGEAAGKEIFNGNYKFKDISLLAAAYRLKIPVTVHIGIGYDIIHEHPNFNGAAAGALSYNDFLIFAEKLLNLENGMVMNFGSAIMAPEVYLKALSMARNIAAQEGKEIKHFTTLVCDLHELPDDYNSVPPKDSAAYYFRPWKTMLVRTVADGGESIYIKGKHGDLIPELWSSIKRNENEDI